MTWTAIAALALGTYAMKALGPVVLGTRTIPAGLQRLFTLLAVTLLAALVAISTVVVGRSIEIDARLAGLGVAALCLWRRASFVVVVVAAAASTAALRAAGL